jgi:hypothetical protein
MVSDQKTINFDFSQWRIRIDERSRNRMKLTIKLNKDEAQAFKNFTESLQPDGMSYDSFIKQVFIAGFNTINMQAMQETRDYVLANKEELAASGINVIEDEDGGIRLEDSNAAAE